MVYKYPKLHEDFADFRTAAEDWILPGYTPERPLLPRDVFVLTAGSCFAAHIAAALCRIGMRAKWVNVPEVYNSPLATYEMLQRTTDPDEGGRASRDLVGECGLFILTVGVAQHPFLHGHPILVVNKRDNRKLDWRLLTVEEIRESILGSIETVRSINPSIKIVLTLSPIPFERTFVHPSAMGTDCLSKSLIRVGIQSVLEMKMPDI